MAPENWVNQIWSSYIFLNNLKETRSELTQEVSCFKGKQLSSALNKPEWNYLFYAPHCTKRHFVSPHTSCSAVGTASAFCGQRWKLARYQPQDPKRTNSGATKGCMTCVLGEECILLVVWQVKSILRLCCRKLFQIVWFVNSI